MKYPYPVLLMSKLGDFDKPRTKLTFCANLLMRIEVVVRLSDILVFHLVLQYTAGARQNFTIQKNLNELIYKFHQTKKFLHII